MKVWRRKQFLLSLVLTAVMVCFGPQVRASSTFQSNSSNYGVNEVFFGSGGNLNECSTNYCTKTSAGELVVGNSLSGNYQVRAGFNTSDIPVLEFSVNGGPINLGILNGSLVSDGSTTFSVLDYLSSGYNVILAGAPPSATLPAGTHTLTAMTSAAGSSPGTEQFGINLVGNTAPNIGTAAQQVPDTTFGFGAASSGYNTANQFKFNVGDTVASSAKSSGETLYTLSVIANISNGTPSGSYSGQIGLVAVATF